MSSNVGALALVLTIAVSSLHATAGVSGTLIFDPSKTLIEFRLLGSIHTTHRIFKLERGTIAADLAAGEASGSIVVDARSGDSGIGERDDRMKDSVLEVQKVSEKLLLNPSMPPPSLERTAISIQGCKES